MQRFVSNLNSTFFSIFTGSWFFRIFFSCNVEHPSNQPQVLCTDLSFILLKAEIKLQARVSVVKTATLEKLT